MTVFPYIVDVTEVWPMLNGSGNEGPIIRVPPWWCEPSAHVIFRACRLARNFSHTAVKNFALASFELVVHN